MKGNDIMTKSSTADKPKKTSFFRGVKQEYKKITWPGKNDVTKQTLLVSVICVILGLLIAGIDLGIKYGMQFLTNITI